MDILLGLTNSKANIFLLSNLRSCKYVAFRSLFNVKKKQWGDTCTVRFNHMKYQYTITYAILTVAAITCLCLVYYNTAVECQTIKNLHSERFFTWYFIYLEPKQNCCCLLHHHEYTSAYYSHGALQP